MKNEIMKKTLNKISLKLGKTGLKIKKYSPEITLAAGIGGVIGTVVLACYATTKVEAILDEHHESMKKIDEVIEIMKNEEITSVDEYTEKDIGRDKFIFYSRTAMKLAKTYAPAIIAGVISIGMILWSHGLMKKRYLGAVAMCNAISQAFDQYRSRVRAEGGDALDRHYLYGTKMEEILTETDTGNGKVKKIKEKIETAPEDSKDTNYFTRIWSEGETSAWMRNVNNSLLFLKGQEDIFNCILNTRGFVFLNEVLDALGYPMTPEGAVTGWVKDHGDGYIEFGIRNEEDPQVMSWRRGFSKSVMLNFNVDGNILELI